jgi:bacillithiol biosynthesis cysteine-adding enzyme BshC
MTTSAPFPHRGVPLGELLPEGSLLGGWLAGDVEIGEIAGSLPAGPEEIVAAAEDRPAAAPETVAAIRASLEDRGGPAAARESAAALGRPGTLAVVAGQQPGLLGGPLYSFLKAAGAVRAAEALTAAEGARGSVRRWVPVFWVASEDHDLEEMDLVVLPDEGGRPRRLRAGLRADGRPARDVPAEEPGIDGLLAEVERLLPGGPGRDAALEQLRRTRAGSIARWFSSLLLEWLGPHGLVVMEPDHVRAATRDLLIREIREPGRLTAALGRGQEAVRATGRSPVLAAEREVNLFVVEGGRRRALVREGVGFRPEGTDLRWSTDEVVRRIEEAPTSFSANAALRPLVQNAGLPAGVQLAGATEFAYLAELGPAHADAGVPRARVLPRPSATLVEPRTTRRLERLGLAAEDVLRDPGRLDRAVPREREEEALRRCFASLRNALGATVPTLLERAGPEGSGHRRRATRLSGHLQENVDKLERTVVDGWRTARGTGRRHVERVLGALRPFGRPQERAYGLPTFLSRSGPWLVGRLLATLDPFRFEHLVITLE